MTIQVGKTTQPALTIIPYAKDAQLAYPRKGGMDKAGKVTYFLGRADSDGDVALVCIGDKVDAAALRDGGHAAIKGARENGYDTAVLCCDHLSLCDMAALVEGMYLADYSFTAYKKDEKPHVALYIDGEGLSDKPSHADVAAAIEGVRARCEGVNFARDLANASAWDMYPDAFAQKMTETFRNTGVKAEVFSNNQLMGMGFVGTATVGRGSERKPCFVKLSYCSDTSAPLVALVGKGLTFDMGGMNVKVARNLSNSRDDMSGGGAVAGVFRILSQTKPEGLNVVGLIPLAENLPGGSAYIPSCVIKYPNGVTVEVGNTDAEGRLILADGLIHAGNLGAKVVIDIATLTGGCAAALGDKLAGVFGHGDVVKQLCAIGDACGDLAWHMPLHKAYHDEIESKLADICNIGSKGSSAIHGALFLDHFVPADTEWAHVDIAGVAGVDDEARGYGVRLMYDYIMRHGKCRGIN